MAHETPRPVYRVDDAIPAVLDEPAEGARVTLTFRARGWCQERGGGRVDPVEFRLDGLRIVDAQSRGRRGPDVAAVSRRSATRATRAGKPFSRRSVAPGRHVLTVTFQAGDRRRIYPPRAIEISAPDGPAR